MGSLLPSHHYSQHLLPRDELYSKLYAHEVRLHLNEDYCTTCPSIHWFVVTSFKTCLSFEFKQVTVIV